MINVLNLFYDNEAISSKSKIKRIIKQLYDCEVDEI